MTSNSAKKAEKPTTFDVAGEKGTVLLLRVKSSECDLGLAVGAVLYYAKEGFLGKLRDAGFVGVGCERDGKLIGEVIPENW